MSDMTIQITSQELATILAALRYYQEENMGEPDYRSDRIHAIATDDDTETSLDADGIDDLCMKLNTSGVHDDDSGRPSSSEVEEEEVISSANDEEEEDEDE
jgi:hypothetical protein